MNKNLATTIATFDTDTISEERRTILMELVQYIRAKQTSNEAINLNFICTHNSRRSHLSQVWAQIMAVNYGVETVTCYSGGTEATAMFPKVGETLVHQGIDVLKIAEVDNPIYALKYTDNCPPILCFSKKYDAKFNPQSNFAAIMTCSSADKGCPVILGADKRIPIMYQDPKVSDGTPQQSEVYLERSTQIGTEMKYVFMMVNKNQ